MHSVFLFHSIEAGMDMGIVNAGQLIIYDEIPSDLLKLVEDLIFNKHNNSTQNLLDYAEKNNKGKEYKVTKEEWREKRPVELGTYSLINGIDKAEEVAKATLLRVTNAMGLFNNRL